MTATNGASACGSVSVRVCVRVVIVGSYSSRNREHSSLKNRGAIQLFSALFHLCNDCCCYCVPVSHRKLLTLWQPRYNGSRTSRSSFRQLPMALVCVRVCVLCVCAIVNTTHAIDNTGQFQSTSPLNFKASAQCSSGTTATAAAVQHQPVIHIEAPVFPRFNLRHTRDFKPTTSRWEPCIHVHQIHFLRQRFLFWPRVFPGALGCEARRGGACTLGTSLDPGWVPWRVLWAFKVVRAGK